VERKKKKTRKQEMEFKFTKIASLKYRIRIDAPTLPGEEMEKTYEELREIQETIKTFNPSATALFPVYRLWLPVQVNLSPTLDLERFQQVSSIFCLFVFAHHSSISGVEKSFLLQSIPSILKRFKTFYQQHLELLWNPYCWRQLRKKLNKRRKKEASNTQRS
jgi:hypothetical protein